MSEFAYNLFGGHAFIRFVKSRGRIVSAFFPSLFMFSFYGMATPLLPYGKAEFANEMDTARFAQALSLDEIFRAKDAKSLRASIKKQERKAYLGLVCKKQKEGQLPPFACYELSLPADPWCLDLKIKQLNLEILKEALSSKALSALCRKHLEKKQKILLYRQKDSLLPELKNKGVRKKLENSNRGGIKFKDKLFFYKQTAFFSENLFKKTAVKGLPL